MLGEIPERDGTQVGSRLHPLCHSNYADMQAWLNADQRRMLRWSCLRQFSILALMAVTSCFVSAFDDSGRLFLSVNSESPTLARLALPFTQWDTLHFLGIAKDGYATEQHFAFMPGVPLLLRFFGKRLHLDETFDAALAVLGTSLLANVVSVCLPLLLYRCENRQKASRYLAETDISAWQYRYLGNDIASPL